MAPQKDEPVIKYLLYLFKIRSVAGWGPVIHIPEICYRSKGVQLIHATTWMGPTGKDGRKICGEVQVTDVAQCQSRPDFLLLIAENLILRNNEQFLSIDILKALKLWFVEDLHPDLKAQFLA